MLTNQPPTGARQDRLRDLRRLARRYRRWAGAALVGVSVVLVLGTLAPPPPPTVSVTTAADDLAAGTVLATEHVETRQVDVKAATSAPTGAGQLLGRVLASPVTAGEQLSESRLLGEELLVGTPPGTVALPVRVADPGAATLVSAGNRIDLLATVPSDDGYTVRQVGSNLVVLLAGAPAEGGESTGIGPLSGAGAGDDPLGGLIVVAASPAQARSVVAGAAQSPLWLVMRRG